MAAHKRERAGVAECHCRGPNGLSGIGDLPSTAEVAQATLTPAVLLQHEGELLLLPHPAIQIASTNSISAAAWRRFILIFLEARIVGSDAVGKDVAQRSVSD